MMQVACAQAGRGIQEKSVYLIKIQRDPPVRILRARPGRPPQCTG